MFEASGRGEGGGRAMMDALLAPLRKVAPDRADISILQPAGPFLETAGEDMRRRIFLTDSIDGSLNCLRPEFTIPICLHYQNRGGRYAYGGTVFHQNRSGGNEFLQAGLEDLGNSDRAAADAACIADMLDILSLAGLEHPRVVLGDQNLFGIVVENLKLPPAVAARLVRNFGEPAHLEHLIDVLTSDKPQAQGDSEAARLALSGDVMALTTHVDALMQEGGLRPYAGRGPADIAARMMDKVQEARFRLDPRQAEILCEFLVLETTLDNAGAELTAFAAASGFDFADRLALFEQRTACLRDRGVDLNNIVYRASFGRKLDYYTGLLFEVEVGGVSVAGGGRYDHLCTLLGSDEPVPAVGFSILPDRLTEVLQ